MQSKNEIKIFSNLVSRLLGSDLVRGMILNLHKKNEVKSYVNKSFDINKFSKYSKSYIKKKEASVIRVELTTAIEYLEKSIKEDKDKHRTVRKKWLSILKFIQKYNKELTTCFDFPNETNHIFESLEEAKERELSFLKESK